MKLPAQALAEIYAKEVEPGRLFRFRDDWALRVTHDEGFEGFLMLGGGNAGRVHMIGQGMAPSLALVAPFGWFPTVASDTEPSREATIPLTLAITSVGPVLSGIDARSHFDDDYLSFGLDGRGVDVANLRRTSRYERWSAELCLDARPFTGLGTLFEVDRSGSAC